MPTPNPLQKIEKKLEALQAKAEKLHTEISALRSLVAEEAAKAPVPEAKEKAASPKKAKEPKADAVPGEAKKRGRPKSAKAEDAAPSAPKKRGRPSKKNF